MSSSATTTPRNLFQTPKRLANRKSNPSETPDCYSTVTLETPVISKQRSFNNSKDKFDEASNLKVAVRIRPMCHRELSNCSVSNVVAVHDQDVIIRAIPVGSIGVGSDHIFQYDHVFWSYDDTSLNYASQDDVFITMGKPLLNSAFKGYNACLFAYGQTGSGKSYSMMGENINDSANLESEHAGIIPRFCKELFTRIADLSSSVKASVEVSYFEIYNEKIHDLLAAPSNVSDKRTALKVREHPTWGPYIVDLSVHPVKSLNELRGWLRIGNKNRATAATIMNEKSSRSHSIFRIDLSLLDNESEGDPGRRSKVSLVDLAGSERIGTSTNNEERLKQGVCINKSLLTLGKVISALADQKKGNQFVPYRDSVLTWLLKESLGGNSLTSMLATITPASTHVDETLATLRYACQARSIVNRARINEDPHDRLIRELRSEVERLRALKKDYERNSSTPVVQIDDSSSEAELEELRKRLTDTENQLQSAESDWSKRFHETRQKQLEELAEAEKQKAELQSHIRVMNMLDTNVSISPYKSNFLEELECILSESNTSPDREANFREYIEDFKNWCLIDGLDLQFSFKRSSNTIVITNLEDKLEAACSIENLKGKEQYASPKHFIQSLMWSKKPSAAVPNKLSKSEMENCFKNIYNSVAVLQPSANDDENVRLSYAKVLKAVQAFESNVKKSNLKSPLSAKSVKFKI